MADGTSLGQPRDLPPVRLGNTMQPLVLTANLRAGVLNMTGARIVAQLFLRADDAQPIVHDTIRLRVTDLPPAAGGQPRCRIDLSKEAVWGLWERATSSVAQTRQPSRTVFSSASLETTSGDRYPLLYGKLVIVAGASSGA